MIALVHFISVGSSLQYSSELWSGGRESNEGVIPMDYDTYTATVSFMFDTCSSTATTGPFG